MLLVVLPLVVVLTPSPLLMLSPPVPLVIPLPDGLLPPVQVFVSLVVVHAQSAPF